MTETPDLTLDSALNVAGMVSKRLNREMARYDINDPEGRDALATRLEIASEWWAANPDRLPEATRAAIRAGLPPYALWGHGEAADALLVAASMLRAA